MSMYPTYELQVGTPEDWQQVEETEASNRPHHYDILRAKFDQLVRNTKPFAAHFVKGFGFRIICDGLPVDEWHID